MYSDHVTHIRRHSDNAIIPMEPLNRDYAEYQRWLDACNTPEPAAAPLIDPAAMLIAAVQNAMDVAARARGYDDLMAAISYRGDKNAKFAEEAEAFFEWRSDTWTTAYAVLADVQAGLRDLPSIDEALALIPPLDMASRLDLAAPGVAAA